MADEAAFASAAFRAARATFAVLWARAGEFAVRLLKLSLRLVRRGACRFEICLERCLINDEKRLAASDEFAFLIKLPLQDAAHLRPDLHLIGTLGLPHHLMPLGNVFRLPQA